LLEVRNLTVSYDTTLVLDGVSFIVNAGEIVAIIGPNGAGKSTTLKAICGLVNLQSGEILFQGENIKGMQPYQLVRKGLCLVPQGGRVFRSMTVLENLEIAGLAMDKKASLREDMDKIFDLFPVLKERRKQRAGTLSSGEQQMLAIGRTLMLRPKLLLMDEPSSGLSPVYVEILFDKIKEINRRGTTILLVEQNVRKALESVDRFYVFEFGRITLEDRAENLLREGETWKKVSRRIL